MGMGVGVAGIVEVLKVVPVGRLEVWGFDVMVLVLNVVLGMALEVWKSEVMESVLVSGSSGPHVPI